MVNIQKYQELFNGIETEADRIESILQDSNEYTNGKTLSINVIRSFNLETINYSSFKDIDCRCIPYVHFSNYWNDIAYKYLSCLYSLKRLGDFKVPRKQMIIQKILRIDRIDTDTEKYCVTFLEPDNTERKNRLVILNDKQQAGLMPTCCLSDCPICNFYLR